MRGETDVEMKVTLTDVAAKVTLTFSDFWEEVVTWERGKVIREIIAAVGEGDLLNEIGEQACVDHFGIEVAPSKDE